MLLESLARLKENETRLREIVVVLGKYGLADWLGSRQVGWLRKWLVASNGQELSRFSHDARIRLVFLELGTTFIKLGQMLSMRPELVGRGLAAELSKLQSSTPADPIDVVRRTIEADLGKPPEALFAEFSPGALASASIAQVHRARLHDGTWVAVKVQHDGIEAKIHRDLDLLQGLAELAQKHIPGLQPYRPVNTVREFRQTLLRELDLRTERRNLEEFVRRFADDNGVRFPRSFPELSGQRVLTMELLEGTSGCDVAVTPPQDVDLALFARRAGTMYLDMIFRDGFFHADPHPGNYVILSGGVVGILDCGMVGRLNDALREDFEGALYAIAQRDAEQLTERVSHLGSPPPDLDRDALRNDLEEFVAEYASRPIAELNLSAALGEMFDIIARYRIVLPRNASLVLRTVMVLEGSAKQLDPAFSLMELVTDYYRSHAGGRWLKPARWMRDAQSAARDYDRLIRSFPKNLADILDRFRAGTLVVRNEHSHLQASVHRLVRGLLVASLVTSAALLLGRGDSATWRTALGLAFMSGAMILGVQLLRSIATAERDPRE
jgi:ubiquinone biosynthesis protein